MVLERIPESGIGFGDIVQEDDIRRVLTAVTSLETLGFVRTDVDNYYRIPQQDDAKSVHEAADELTLEALKSRYPQVEWREEELLFIGTAECLAGTKFRIPKNDPGEALRGLDFILPDADDTEELEVIEDRDESEPELVPEPDAPVEALNPKDEVIIKLLADISDKLDRLLETRNEPAPGLTQDVGGPVLTLKLHPDGQDVRYWREQDVEVIAGTKISDYSTRDAIKALKGFRWNRARGIWERQMAKRPGWRDVPITTASVEVPA